MSTWWQRLGEVMARKSLDVPTVAVRAKVNEKTLYGYLKGDTENPRGDVIARLARAVHVSERFLRLGETDGAPPLRRIPLIDMNRLGTLKPGEDPSTVWDGESEVTATADVSDKAFAIRIADASNEPSMNAGDVVICDPEAALTPGNFAVAVTTDDETAHFGRYRPASHRAKDRFRIVPDNKNFPPVVVDESAPGFIVSRAVKRIHDI